MGKLYQYFVEGKCEEAFINEYKNNKDQLFESGKLEVINVITEKIPIPRIRNLKHNTIIILVYDTDVKNYDILNENIKNINIYAPTCKTIHIQSVENFENEIVRSTNLNNINKMFNTESTDEFKAKFIACKNLRAKMKKIAFNYKKIWTTLSNDNNFSKYTSEKEVNKILKYKK